MFSFGQVFALLLLLLNIKFSLCKSESIKFNHAKLRIDDIVDLEVDDDTIIPISNFKDGKHHNSVYRHVIQHGLSGAIAGICQVVALMWLRTISAYQYRYGVSMMVAMMQLYEDGGVMRFYRGWPFAIFQGPLAKFGSISANEFANVVCSKYSNNKVGNIMLSSLLGGLLSMMWRFLLMPIDTCKTVLQVDGEKGLKSLIHKVVGQHRISLLFEGTAATLVMTLVSHYPWFLVYNLLDKVLLPSQTSLSQPLHNNNDDINNNNKSNVTSDHISHDNDATTFSSSSYRYIILRSASIGFAATIVSDILSNFFRIIKTVKQTIGSKINHNSNHHLYNNHNVINSLNSHSTTISYLQIITHIYQQQGMVGLVGRGLLPKILSDGLQGLFFTVIWKLINQYQDDNRIKAKAKKSNTSNVNRRDSK